jgi:hypothetical protein
MYVHIFGFRWKPEATEAQKERAKADILAFRGRIPGLVDLHVGHNESPHGQGYTFAGLMRFAGKQAFEAYVVHPQHQALLQWLKPLIDPVELDFLALD